DARERTLVEPLGHLATILGDLVARVRVIEGQGDRVGRRELQHALRVDALALEVGERVAQVGGHRVQRALRRRVDDLDAIAPRFGSTGPARHPPLVFGGLDLTTLALLEAGAQAGAPALVVAGEADD